MSHTLEDIARNLRDANKKVQLIYAFNGSGKTRLSRKFKELIDPKSDDVEEDQKSKFLYYNAFTEDLFYWDNDLHTDADRKLKIQPNAYTKSALKDLGLDANIITNFQHYTNKTLTPKFAVDFSEVTFSIERGDETNIDNVKISKGEESNFIWSIFYTLIDQIIDTLNTVNIEDRETDQFNDLEYIFIDDPVSSLDDNHLIQLAVDIAGLIKSSEYTNGNGLRFVITTHSPLFYNILYSELKLKSGYILSQFDNGNFNLEKKHGSSNTAFSYHLHIKRLIEEAIEANKIERYHFMLLRNLYEKVASFFGYKEWQELLDTAEGDKKAYYNRIIQFSSHSKLSNEEIKEPTEPEQRTVELLLNNLIDNYGSWALMENDNA